MIVILEYIVVYFFEAAIAGMFFRVVCKGKEELWKQNVAIALGYGLLFMLSRLNEVTLNTVAFFAVNVCLVVLLYDVEVGRAVFYVLYMTGVMTLSEIICSGILNLFSSKFAVTEQYAMKLWLLIVSSKSVYMLVLMLVPLKAGIGYKERQKTDKYFWLLTFIPLCSCFVFSVLFELGLSVELSTFYEKLLVACSAVLFCMNIVVYVIYTMSQKRNRHMLEQELELQKEHDEREYYKRQLLQDRNQRIMIHDIRNHMNTLEAMLENGDYEDAQKYLKQMYDTPGMKETVHFSRNVTLNLVLNRYNIQFFREKIVFYIDVVSEMLDGIAAVDLTTLLSNLLDNAYEAAVQCEHPEIDLRICDTLIVLKNTSKPVAFEKDGYIQSSKTNAGSHGYGRKSIARVAKKYHGDMQEYYSEETGMFHTVIQFERL